jgi:hypothetical protein
MRSTYLIGGPDSDIASGLHAARSHHGGHRRTDSNYRGKKPHNNGKKGVDTSSGKKARSGQTIGALNHVSV